MGRGYTPVHELHDFTIVFELVRYVMLWCVSELRQYFGGREGEVCN